MSARFNRLNAGLILICLALYPACSSDDGSVTIEASCAAFQADSTPGDGMLVTVFGDESNCQTAFLELRVQGMEDLTGAKFVVKYDPTSFVFIFGFDEATDAMLDGSVLGADDSELLFNVDEDPIGTITIGIGRVDPTEGVDTEAGNDLLMKLLFARATASGSSRVDFEANSLQKFTSVDEQPIDVPPGPSVGYPNGFPWLGGTLVIVTQ